MSTNNNIIKVEFEDNGQDFLEWDIDVVTGEVVDCRPFQSSIWCGLIVTNLKDLKIGDKVTYQDKKVSRFVKYPIVQISKEVAI